jgi:hypothetical protein
MSAKPAGIQKHTQSDRQAAGAPNNRFVSRKNPCDPADSLSSR